MNDLKFYRMARITKITRILRSLKDHTTIKIYGTDYPTKDGTGIRDYVHIYDLGKAHILSMDKLWKGAPSSIYNIGNGQGYSVKEVITAAEKVTGLKVNAIECPRREGDSSSMIADATKARQELGWEPDYPGLEAMIEHAWKALSE